MKRLKEINGITLIALVITIIVMLILLGVTLSVVLNNGLMENAQRGRRDQEIERDKELLYTAALGCMENGKVIFNGGKGLDNNLPYGFSGTNGKYTKGNNTFYVDEDGSVSGKGETTYANKRDLTLGNNVKLIEKEDLTDDFKRAIDEGKISAVLKETIDGKEVIAVVPTGFTVSSVEGENTISGGLVIYDGQSNENRNNEFVWIPYTKDEQYEESGFEALTNIDIYNRYYIYDSQENLDFYYGEGFYNYSVDFNYEEDKTKLENSINKYKGFYCGRYETTIDNGQIGVKKNTEVLTAGHALKDGTNPNIDNNIYTSREYGYSPNTEKYYYRWWGLYKAEKDLYENSNSVFSLMITQKEWNEIMEYTNYGEEIRPLNSYNNIDSPDLSGSKYKGTTDSFDINKNIYDLAGNVAEWTTNKHTWRIIYGRHISK